MKLGSVRCDVTLIDNTTNIAVQFATGLLIADYFGDVIIYVVFYSLFKSHEDEMSASTRCGSV
jgi:hypothetical protein